MEKSFHQKVFRSIALLSIIVMGVVSAFILAYGLSISYDTFNLYKLNFEGFEFYKYSRGIGNPYLFSVVSIGMLAIGILIAFGSLASIRENFLNLWNKFAIAIPVMVAVFAVTTFDFNSQEKTLIIASNMLYKDLGEKYEDPNVFTNSTPAQEFKLAIDTKNIENLKSFINNPERLKGLTESDMFNKLLTVQNISNKSVRDNFNRIYSDRYITEEEYKSFKKNAMNSIMSSLTADVQVNNDNDEILFSAL
jgi:hypothetical protein